MRSITRTIPTTTINVSKIEFVNGKLTDTTLEPIVVFGEAVKADKAKKLILEKYGYDGNYIPRDIKVEENVYEITLEDFVKSAKIVAPKEQDVNSEIPAAIPSENV